MRINKKVNIYKATGIFLIILAVVFYYFEEVKETVVELPTEEIVVAITDIPENSIVTKNMITTEKRYSEDVMKNKDIIKAENEVLGKRTVVPLFKGEVINKNRVIENKDYMNNNDHTQIVIALNEADKALQLKEGDYIDIWLEPISQQDNQINLESLKLIEKIQIIKVHDSNYNNISTITKDPINTASNSVFVPAYITIELEDTTLKGLYEIDKNKYNIRITRYGEEKLYSTVKDIINRGD